MQPLSGSTGKPVEACKHSSQQLCGILGNDSSRSSFICLFRALDLTWMSGDQGQHNCWICSMTTDRTSWALGPELKCQPCLRWSSKPFILPRAEHTYIYVCMYLQNKMFWILIFVGIISVAKTSSVNKYLNIYLNKAVFYALGMQQNPCPHVV